MTKRSSKKRTVKSEPVQAPVSEVVSAAEVATTSQIPTVQSPQVSSKRKLSTEEIIQLLNARKEEIVTVSHECIACHRTHNHRLDKDTKPEQLFCPYYKKGQSDSCGKRCFSTEEYRKIQAQTVVVEATTS